MKYIHRHLETVLKAMLAQFKVVLITGPRQVGKTTMLREILSDYEYVTLDDMSELDLAKSDPVIFFKNHSFPLIIDEVQYAPELFRQIKCLTDKSELRGQICLTGSQTYHLMQNVTESLAGRIGILEMQGLSMREMLNLSFEDRFVPMPDYMQKRKKSITPYHNIWEVIFRGSMPELSNPDMDWELYYRSYVKSYIERDVRNLLNIKDERVFYQFMVALASRTGQIFNASDLANSLDVTSKTIQSWLSVLEASGIVFMLRPYENNILKRTIQKPKIYFYDTGLVCYLIGWDNPKVAQNGAMSGCLFETFVISEIVKSYLNQGKDTRQLFYYRDRNQKEIDLIIVQNDQLYPIEIKTSGRATLDMAKNFSVLKDTENIHVQMGTILCRCDRCMFLSDTVQALPVEWV